MKKEWPKIPTHLVIILVYVFATLLTSAYFMADTADYVDSIVAHIEGRNYDFWEFGHLFWRPFGAIIFTPVSKLFGEADKRITIDYVLLTINWLAGLVSVCALYGLTRRIVKPAWICMICVLVFIFSHAFLNYSQSGSSYIPGLSMLLVGLYLLTRSHNEDESHLLPAVASGVALAAAVCLWFPYILVLPAAVGAPLLLYRFDREGFRTAIIAATVAGVCILTAYAVIAVREVNISSFDQFRKWVSAASHQNDVRGATRMVFGFARSFIYMGNDGILFKRYLVGDKFNPVSLIDLFRLSLWKFLFFYAFLAAICFNLIRSFTGRRILYLLAAAALPVVALAVFFDGGAVERYLPLYPFVFLALTASLSISNALRPMKWLILVFCFLVIMVDGVAMSNAVLGRQQQMNAARIADLQGRINAQSRIFTVNWQDQLVNFDRSFPLHPINRHSAVSIGALVTPGTNNISQWREDFASQALATWDKGGELWVSKRVMSDRPLADWNWVEGDDRRVSWTDFYEFFRGVDLGEQSANPDGFVLIDPSSKNKSFFAALLRQKQTPIIGQITK